MKLFISKLCVILAFIGIIDVIVGKIGRYTIHNVPESSAFVSHTIHSILHKKTDILVLGASKAKHGINPYLLQDSLEMDCYNAAEDGCDMMFYDMMFQGINSRRPPKIVIIDMAPLSLMNIPEPNKFLFGAAGFLNKYYEDTYPLWRRLLLNSNLYRYNCFFPLLSSAILGKNSGSKGYTPLDGIYERPVMRTENEFRLNNLEQKYLDSIVQTCKRERIELYIYISPCYYHDNVKFDEYVANYCLANDIHFYDYSKHEDFLTTKYYKDRDHLNRIGAEYFTKMMIADIKRDYNDIK